MLFSYENKVELVEHEKKHLCAYSKQKATHFAL